jgi:hypothetical protein
MASNDAICSPRKREFDKFQYIIFQKVLIFDTLGKLLQASSLAITAVNKKVDSTRDLSGLGNK